jgi:hypothetical protein
VLCFNTALFMNSILFALPPQFVYTFYVPFYNMFRLFMNIIRKNICAFYLQFYTIVLFNIVDILITAEVIFSSTSIYKLFG